MITIICEGGWKYEGEMINSRTDFWGEPIWIEIKTKKGRIKVFGNYIVSILYD
jgi:hypothetical protein